MVKLEEVADPCGVPSGNQSRVIDVLSLGSKKRNSQFGSVSVHMCVLMYVCICSYVYVYVLL